MLGERCLLGERAWVSSATHSYLIVLFPNIIRSFNTVMRDCRLERQGVHQSDEGYVNPTALGPFVAGGRRSWDPRVSVGYLRELS